MSDRIVQNWLSLAEYDLATAEAMLETHRYLYVGFMAQQAVEKLLKACYVRHHVATPPYTHSLLRLLAELPWQADVPSEKVEAMERLNSYYIESRYTEDIEELKGMLDREEAERLLTVAQELFAWIKAKL
jgi:HEPN domain-containing protein